MQKRKGFRSPFWFGNPGQSGTAEEALPTVGGGYQTLPESCVTAPELAHKMHCE